MRFSRTTLSCRLHLKGYVTYQTGDAFALDHETSESMLPDVGLLGVEDPETGDRRVIDSGSARVRAAYAQQAERVQARLRDTLRRIGVDLLELSTGEDYERPLVRFFRDRARRVARAGG